MVENLDNIVILGSSRSSGWTDYLSAINYFQSPFVFKMSPALTDFACLSTFVTVHSLTVIDPDWDQANFAPFYKPRELLNTIPIYTRTGTFSTILSVSTLLAVTCAIGGVIPPVYTDATFYVGEDSSY
jgi:hypothetical protein